jgi:hypothetical protein
MFDTDTQMWSQVALPSFTTNPVSNEQYSIYAAGEDITNNKSFPVFAVSRDNKTLARTDSVWTYDDDTDSAHTEDIECKIVWGIFELEAESRIQEFRAWWYNSGGTFDDRKFSIGEDMTNVLAGSPAPPQASVVWEDDSDQSSWGSEWHGASNESRMWQPRLDFEFTHTNADVRGTVAQFLGMTFLIEDMDQL